MFATSVAILAAAVVPLLVSAIEPLRIDGLPTDGPAATAPKPPLEMQVAVVGNPSDQWSISVTGRVTLAADAGLLTVQQLGLVNAPVQAQVLALEANSTFSREFPMLPAPEGHSSYSVEFDYQNPPFYGLFSQYTVDVDRIGPVGVGTATPVTFSGADDDGPEPARPNATAPGSADNNLDGHGGAHTDLSGRLMFVNPAGQWAGCWYCRVEVIDQDIGPDDSLGIFETADRGYFTWNVENGDEVGDHGVDPFFKIWSESQALQSKARVQNTAGNPYFYQTVVLRDDCPDNACNLNTANGCGQGAAGCVAMNTAGNDRTAWWLHENLERSWWYLRWEEGAQPGFNAGRAVAVFPVDDWNGHIAEDAEYHAGGQIHIGTLVTAEDEQAHEHGHFVMYQGYNQGGGNWWFPNSPNGPCNNQDHTMNQFLNNECGWSEGWADYWPIQVLGGTRYTFYTGAWIDLEAWQCQDPPPNPPPPGPCGGANGQGVEGRVAAALVDLFDANADTANEITDQVDHSLNDIWRAFTQGGGDDERFRWYYDNWVAVQNPALSDTDFRCAAQQNTIDFWAPWTCPN